jgi:hypothetical protein
MTEKIADLISINTFKKYPRHDPADLLSRYACLQSGPDWWRASRNGLSAARRETRPVHPCSMTITHGVLNR